MLLIASGDELEDEAWRAWFEDLTNPAPLSGWEAAWQDTEGLARRHNLRAFALEIYLNATLSEQPGIQALQPHALGVMQALR